MSLFNEESVFNLQATVKKYCSGPNRQKFINWEVKTLNFLTSVLLVYKIQTLNCTFQTYPSYSHMKEVCTEAY